jgi:hypothetical protein
MPSWGRFQAVVDPEPPDEVALSLSFGQAASISH